MKATRLQRWSGHFVDTRFTLASSLRQHYVATHAIRNATIHSPSSTMTRTLYTARTSNSLTSRDHKSSSRSFQLPSPPPDAALNSAKLAALHARLALPKQLPLQTLARTLVDPSADQSLEFNNKRMSTLGSSLLSYHVTEWLMVTYPRLPMAVLYAAIAAYIGPATLMKIGQEWGVESAAYPGSEVDPGLLQFSKEDPGATKDNPLSSATRTAQAEFFRRGMSSRVVYDNEFGDLEPKEKVPSADIFTDEAFRNFVQALVGAIYLHGGAQAAKDFIKAHVLSRHLPMDKLFEIRNSTRDLARLCAREGFQAPVARIVSETGRLSRHPVFVVGIFSGNDKLGEGSGASLDEARYRAAISALKAWYLYSPTAGKTGILPSDVENGGEWMPAYIDLGEIVA